MAITDDPQQDGDTIWVASLVSATTREGVVMFTWGEKRAQLSLEEARAHARRILEAAEAAETDALLVEFAQSTGMDERQALGMLRTFRAFRTARQPDKQQ